MSLHVRLRHVTLGGHVHVRVFVGKDEDHLAKAGDLVVTVEEWERLGMVATYCNPMVRPAAESIAGVTLSVLPEEER